MNRPRLRNPLGRTATLIWLVPLLMLGLITLAACGGTGASDSDAGSDMEPAARDESMAEDLPSGARDQGGGADSVAGVVAGEEAGTVGSAATNPVQQRAVIASGVVSLHSKDVGDALFDVQRVVDTHRGEVTEEESQTDDDGGVSRSRLVIRVPVAEFDDTVADLKEVGTLVSASTGTEDVTTQVIDTQVRIRAQEKSLERIEILLARAQSIRDIVAIEAQLTRRQAELDSLKGQMAWLEDQTSMSTITVHLEKTPEKAEKEESEAGFLAGLSAGWHGLKTFLVGAATIVGAILPFALLGLVLGVPLWLALRRTLRSRRPGSGDGPTEAAGAA